MTRWTTPTVSPNSTIGPNRYDPGGGAVDTLAPAAERTLPVTVT